MNKNIQELLKTGTEWPVYEFEAPEEASYPYIVFEARRLSASEGIDNYVLEVNAWDKHDTYARVTTVMKELEQAINREHVLNDDELLIVYKGGSQSVPDENKQIKRIREQFDLIVVGRR